MTQPLHPQQWVKTWVRVVDPYPDADNEIPVLIPQSDVEESRWPTVMVDIDMLITPETSPPGVVDGLVDVQYGEYAEKAANND